MWLINKKIIISIFLFLTLTYILISKKEVKRKHIAEKIGFNNFKENQKKINSKSAKIYIDQVIQSKITPVNTPNKIIEYFFLDEEETKIKHNTINEYIPKDKFLQDGVYVDKCSEGKLIQDNFCLDNCIGKINTNGKCEDSECIFCNGDNLQNCELIGCHTLKACNECAKSTDLKTTFHTCSNLMCEKIIKWKKE